MLLDSDNNSHGKNAESDRFSDIQSGKESPHRKKLKLTKIKRLQDQSKSPKRIRKELKLVEY